MFQMSNVLDNFANDLLVRVASDYNLDLKELKMKYLQKGVSGKTVVVEIVKDKSKKEPEPVKDKSKKEPEPVKEKVSSEDRKCGQVTVKGTRCKYNRVGDSCFCKIHTPKGDTVEVEKKEKRGKKEKKGKKETPGHGHTLSEDMGEGEICRLCETHGDVSHPNLPDAEFELSEINETPDDLASRLRKILSEAEDEDKDPEEEPKVSISVSLKELLGEELLGEEEEEEEASEWD